MDSADKTPAATTSSKTTPVTRTTMTVAAPKKKKLASRKKKMTDWEHHVVYKDAEKKRIVDGVLLEFNLSSRAYQVVSRAAYPSILNDDMIRDDILVCAMDPHLDFNREFKAESISASIWTKQQPHEAKKTVAPLHQLSSIAAKSSSKSSTSNATMTTSTSAVTPSVWTQGNVLVYLWPYKTVMSIAELRLLLPLFKQCQVSRVIVISHRNAPVSATTQKRVQKRFMPKDHQFAGILWEFRLDSEFTKNILANYNVPRYRRLTYVEAAVETFKDGATPDKWTQRPVTDAVIRKYGFQEGDYVAYRLPSSDVEQVATISSHDGACPVPCATLFTWTEEERVKIEDAWRSQVIPE